MSQRNPDDMTKCRPDREPYHRRDHFLFSKGIEDPNYHSLLYQEFQIA